MPRHARGGVDETPVMADLLTLADRLFTEAELEYRTELSAT